MSVSHLKKIAQLRNISPTGVKKQDLIYMLLRSQKNPKENKYLEYLNYDTNNDIHNKVNEIKKQIVELGNTLTNEEITEYIHKII